MLFILFFFYNTKLVISFCRTVSNLPLSELCICPTTFAGVVHYGVFCRKNTILRGTRYGPFKGKIVNTSEIKSFDDNSYMWEVGISGICCF